MRFAIPSAFLALGLLAAPALGQGGAISVVTTGPIETVFDWSRDACVKSNVPDAVTRAFRNADGEVRLILSHSDNRVLVGPDLDNVKPDCRVVFEAGRNPDLAAFDDLSWIAAIHTRDGKRVDALAHSELRGQRIPGQCPAGKYSPCLLNTVTALVSEDGGRSFQAEQPGGQPPMVAALPYPFPTDRTSRVGYSNPTNIIERNGWFYTFMFADQYRAQNRGNCLIRTRTLDDPSSWRAWDGTGFEARFIDPFATATADPESHVCTPVAPKVFGRMMGGLIKWKGGDRTVAIFADRKRDRNGVIHEGIYTSTSNDLIEWTEPTLVMEAQLLWNKSCGETTSYFYPALIDPKAKTFSFEDMGETGFLYMTRYQLEDCKVTWDRDLVRVPVMLKP